MENNIQKEDLLALVKSKIYTIRGQKVMLDFDLAQMYNVKTGSLNQSVKRNIERFPDDFMFQLTETEWEEWKSQYVTSNFLENKEVSDLLSQNVTAKSMNKKRFTPYAFTPFGVDIQYLGNQELLKLQKTAFLASNTIPIEMVLVQSNDV